MLLAFFVCCSLISHLHCIIISHCWCKITSVLGWPANLPLKTLQLSRLFFLALLFFLFTPSPLLHLTSPSLIQQSFEKPAIVLPKSWLQGVSSAVKAHGCRWWEITLHSANVWWCHSPLVPPIFSSIAWRRFYWRMLLQVQDITQPVTQPSPPPAPLLVLHWWLLWLTQHMAPLPRAWAQHLQTRTQDFYSARAGLSLHTRHRLHCWQGRFSPTQS